MREKAADILAQERIHLNESRAALQRMREHTANLQAFGGDHVSTEHLKQALYRRMKALEDDPTVPLFFGRLDYDASLGAEQDETLYIGRRHVTGEAGGEPLVIDWRAGMSRAQRALPLQHWRTCERGAGDHRRHSPCKRASRTRSDRPLRAHLSLPEIRRGRLRETTRASGACVCQAELEPSLGEMPCN